LGDPCGGSRSTACVGLVSSLGRRSVGTIPATRHGEYELRRGNLFLAFLSTLFLFLSALDTALPADSVMPGSKDRCPVCGMFVAKYSRWLAMILFEDGRRVWFDGPRDMLHYYLHMSEYEPTSRPEDVEAIYVTEYNTRRRVRAEGVYFVRGSEIAGPMGPEWIPIQGKQKAEMFLQEYHGESILRWEGIVASAAGGAEHLLEPLLYGRYEPIGVMGAHTHHAGGWMLSYRDMFMEMTGNLQGGHELSEREVLNDFMVAPRDMTMRMQMIGVMYGLRYDLTLMAMVPYLSLKMRHVNRAGIRFRTVSRGVGDLKLSALYELCRRGRRRLILTPGVGLPTGSIDERDDTPAGRNQKLPYPMQLGSGTLDLLPGVTYLAESRAWAWGGQLLATLRLGRNSNDYRLGNGYEVTTWLTRRWDKRFSTSVRIHGKAWGDIHGADGDLNPAMDPTADPGRRGGRKIELLLGAAYDFSEGRHAGHRLALEAGLPVYQYLEGPQLGSDWRITAGWQWAF